MSGIISWRTISEARSKVVANSERSAALRSACQRARQREEQNRAPWPRGRGSNEAPQVGQVGKVGLRERINAV